MHHLFTAHQEDDSGFGRRKFCRPGCSATAVVLTHTFVYAGCVTVRGRAPDAACFSRKRRYLNRPYRHLPDVPRPLLVWSWRTRVAPRARMFRSFRGG